MSATEKKHIIFIGPPGSGKGTQADIVSEILGIPHISVGDIFRLYKRENSKLGKKLAEYIDKGLLVPDELTSNIVFDTLNTERCSHGEILDGFPRTIYQAKLFNEYLMNNNENIYKVIYIDTPDELIIKRMSGRRVCSKCGRIYHMEFNPPKNKGSCDFDGGTLYQRKDDEEYTVRKRLKTYKEVTHPLIDYYKSINLLVKVNGNNNIDKVTEDVIKNLT